MICNMLYDSDAFVVVRTVANQAAEAAVPEDPRNGYEIVDKRCNKSLYLDGPWALYFEGLMDKWNEKTPEQEEVEAALDSLAALAQNPLIVH